ncbi:MAG: hypothetical protein A2735_01805 [Candidatus Yanofskybacteria bacterium RIFCSPHIGHO2_01_FULL_41_21]|uniref:Uncharacterized protein n=1 Tax=Candidatus Yanofskybacteria bacterium RIFCSPHIGHO2_01_FULL_41_21 TaxID=1802660 RepID=A0A1F8EA00_9BACT|nr:MAG: hypothetical protein A2735_01805 [Candidatus Yanofskybacteria bacterium RIFCSPHIGHO2_01_FULL_41_21]
MPQTRETIRQLADRRFPRFAGPLPLLGQKVGFQFLQPILWYFYRNTNLAFSFIFFKTIPAMGPVFFRPHMGIINRGVAIFAENLDNWKAGLK